MMMEVGDRSGLGLGNLESFKHRASFLFKDSLKIARCAFVDVSPAELMTEDATNADEWGPTTKAMADICSVIFNSEDYLRIVQVLHKRFALNSKKDWRKIHKSLILLEYLLCRGPEHLVMEFRDDKKRFEELTHFDYVDWTGIDRGAAVQRRAKQVLRLLMDEAFYKEERARAQKISRGISGFGSQSISHRSPRGDTKSMLECDFMEHEEDSATLLLEDDVVDTKRFPADMPCSPTLAQCDSSSDAFSAWSPRENGSANGRSTTSDGNSQEESPTSILQLVREYSPRGDEYRKAPLLRKLPPPPPVAEYKCFMKPRSPPSLGPRKQAGTVKSARVLPDLILI